MNEHERIKQISQQHKHAVEWVRAIVAKNRETEGQAEIPIDSVTIDDPNEDDVLHTVTFTVIDGEIMVEAGGGVSENGHYPADTCSEFDMLDDDVKVRYVAMLADVYERREHYDTGVPAEYR